MKIVVLDGYTLNPGDLSWDEFKNFGELTIYDRTSKEDVVDRIGDAEVILVNKIAITKEILDLCPSVKYIGELATGYNNIDVLAAKEKGVVVTNIPTYGTNGVAQFAIALLLELCSHVGSHSDAVKNGDWTNSIDWCFWNNPLMELDGKTMGFIGFGRIGQRTAKIAEAMGMKILAYARNKRPELESENCRFVELEELLEKSDVISLHAPLNADTEGIINKNNIEKMKDGVLIINTARGALIVEEDLRDALNIGKVGGAACDVVSIEPIREDNPLLNAKNIIITPHIAWAPRESRERLMNIALDNLKAFIMGESINRV